MRTFSIQVLGCKVNQYEAEQMAALLRARGLIPTDPSAADLRIVHTCSVTAEAGKKSGQFVRRATRLAVLQPSVAPWEPGESRGKTVVTGCWATSDHEKASNLPGVDAVIANTDDVHGRLNQLLDTWTISPAKPQAAALPIYDRESSNQRAFLKIQDGCDAFCTYCIIPQLRPKLWSKPIEECIDEAARLVAVGHNEIVLTGIFLGAYGHPTALRRRQQNSDDIASLAKLVEVLCMRVPGLKRLRLSSLEPGDLNSELISVLKSHEQLVPHFHLPLQSGSDEILRRMNRQYRRDDFLRMIEQVNENFDRPAMTTDIIVGFPGETDSEFAETLDVVERAKFIHTHAFSYSTRPKTAAARWKSDFVPPAVANERIKALNDRAVAHSYEFRRQFVGQEVELLVERDKSMSTKPSLRHGRCERYFDVQFESVDVHAGDSVRVRIDEVTSTKTFGTLVHASELAAESAISETAWAR